MSKTLLVAMFTFLSGIAAAQAVKPTLGIDHLVRVKAVMELQQQAMATCKELTVTKNFVAAQKETTEGIEKAYNGWTLDWNNMVLVEKVKGQ